MIERAEKLLDKAEEIEKEIEKRTQTLKEEIRNSRKALALKILEQEEKNIKKKISNKKSTWSIENLMQIGEGIYSHHSTGSSPSLTDFLPSQTIEQKYIIVVSKQRGEIKLVDLGRPKGTASISPYAVGEYAVGVPLEKDYNKAFQPQKLQLDSNSELSKNVPWRGYGYHSLTSDSLAPKLEEPEEDGSSSQQEKQSTPLEESLNRIKKEILEEETGLEEEILKRYWEKPREEREELWEKNIVPNYLTLKVER